MRRNIFASALALAALAVVPVQADDVAAPVGAIWLFWALDTVVG